MGWRWRQAGSKAATFNWQQPQKKIYTINAQKIPEKKTLKRGGGSPYPTYTPTPN